MPTGCAGRPGRGCLLSGSEAGGSAEAPHLSARDAGGTPHDHWHAVPACTAGAGHGRWGLATFRILDSNMTVQALLSILTPALRQMGMASSSSQDLPVQQPMKRQVAVLLLNANSWRAAARQPSPWNMTASQLAVPDIASAAGLTGDIPAAWSSVGQLANRRAASLPILA